MLRQRLLVSAHRPVNAGLHRADGGVDAGHQAVQTGEVERHREDGKVGKRRRSGDDGEYTAEAAELQQ